MSTERNSNREDIRHIVSSVYSNILNRSINSSSLDNWTNKLMSKQISLYDFLISVLIQDANSINIMNLIQSLYSIILKRKPNMIENSQLVSAFNTELRRYGSRERALRKMLTSFVKSSNISKYCTKIGIDNV